MTRGLRASLLFVCLFFHGAAGASPAAVDFFEPPGIVSLALSPAGFKVAVAKRVEQEAVVDVLRLEEEHQRTVFSARMRIGVQESYVRNVGWVDDRYLLVSLVESREAVADLLETKNVVRHYVVDTEDEAEAPVTYEIKTGGRIVHLLPNESGRLLFARAGRFSKVYKIDVEKLNVLGQPMTRRTLVDGGQFTRANEVASFDGFALRWFFDRQGEVLSALAVKAEGQVTISAWRDGAWHSVRSWIHGDLSRTNTADSEGGLEIDPIVPVAIGSTADEYYVIEEKEGQSDGVYLVNLASGERTLVYRHAAADIFDVVTDPRTGQIAGVGLVDNGVLRYEYLSDGLADVAALLRDRFADVALHLVGSDAGDNVFVLAASSFRDAGTFYVYRKATGELKLIERAMPWLDPATLSVLETGSVESHGLDIPWLLTVPATGEAPYPLVLLPHGGPIGVMDSRNYNPVAQFLGARGFAVLQVNYRGSAGFGDAFLEAGKKEWGGKILDDIIAAHDAVASRDDIDGSRSCIAGGSYGGYAALALAVREPDRFRCVASVAGVSDVMLLVSSRRHSDEVQEWLSEYVGDPDADADALEAISPLHRATEVTVPVLLVHGADDTVVDAEHSWRMAHALEQAGHVHELTILEDMGHSPSDTQQAAHLYERVAAFLEEHLNVSAAGTRSAAP